MKSWVEVGFKAVEFHVQRQKMAWKDYFKARRLDVLATDSLWYQTAALMVLTHTLPHGCQVEQNADSFVRQPWRNALFGLNDVFLNGQRVVVLTVPTLELDTVLWDWRWLRPNLATAWIVVGLDLPGEWLTHKNSPLEAVGHVLGWVGHDALEAQLLRYDEQQGILAVKDLQPLESLVAYLAQVQPVSLQQSEPDTHRGVQRWLDYLTVSLERGQIPADFTTSVFQTAPQVFGHLWDCEDCAGLFIRNSQSFDQWRQQEPLTKLQSQHFTLAEVVQLSSWGELVPKLATYGMVSVERLYAALNLWFPAFKPQAESTVETARKLTGQVLVLKLWEGRYSEDWQECLWLYYDHQHPANLPQELALNEAFPVLVRRFAPEQVHWGRFLELATRWFFVGNIADKLMGRLAALGKQTESEVSAVFKTIFTGRGRLSESEGITAALNELLSLPCMESDGYPSLFFATGLLSVLFPDRIMTLSPPTLKALQSLPAFGPWHDLLRQELNTVEAGQLMVVIQHQLHAFPGDIWPRQADMALFAVRHFGPDELLRHLNERNPMRGELRIGEAEVLVQVKALLLAIFPEVTDLDLQSVLERFRELNDPQRRTGQLWVRVVESLGVG